MNCIRVMRIRQMKKQLERLKERRERRIAEGASALERICLTEQINDLREKIWKLEQVD